MLSTPIDNILSALDDPLLYNTLIARCAHAISKDEDIMQIDMSLDIYGPLTTVTLSVDSSHPILGFLFHDELNTPTIQDCVPRTLASKIECWRSHFRYGTIRAINGKIIDTIPQLKHIIQEILTTKVIACSIKIAHEDFGNLHIAQGLPQMHFNQLKAVAHHLNFIKYGDNCNLHEYQDEDIIVHKAIGDGIIPHKILKQQKGWDTWVKLEWKQLNSYNSQNMVGDPIPKSPPKLDKKGK